MSECVHCVNRRIFYKHLDCRSSGCECSSYDRLTARIARQDKHIRDLETQLARVRELKRIPHFDSYGNKDYELVKADELEAALQSDAGAGSNQPDELAQHRSLHPSKQKQCMRLLCDRIRGISHEIRSQIEDIPGWANELCDIADELETAATSESARLGREIAEDYCREIAARITVDGWLEKSHGRMLRYLELRGLLECHPDNPNLVRIKERGDG